MCQGEKSLDKPGKSRVQYKGYDNSPELYSPWRIRLAA